MSAVNLSITIIAIGLKNTFITYICDKCKLQFHRILDMI